MTKPSGLETMLTGGHPNSLGKTLEVVEIVVADKGRLQELFECYQSSDATVRLRVSSCFKRIFRRNRHWFTDYIDRFQSLIPQLRQPSAEWTLAEIHLELEELLSDSQKSKAVEITKRQLKENNDWIVMIKSINLLEHWAKTDVALRSWLLEILPKIRLDNRKSVSKRAEKALNFLAKT